MAEGAALWEGVESTNLCCSFVGRLQQDLFVGVKYSLVDPGGVDDFRLQR